MSAGIFMQGDPLLIYIIEQNGELKVISLGNDLKRAIISICVPANCWFASRPAPKSEYCFVGCTVSPAFEFEDLELADAAELSVMYPQHKPLL
jgi:predicted cupin superfamily sugar epimerase